MGRKSESKARRPASLRGRAEDLLSTASDDIKKLPPNNIKALVHELQVHQLELEIQNEELRGAQLELAQSRDRYNDLYDFAPVGFVTLDSKGTILEANLTAAGLLDVPRSALMRRKLNCFVAKNSQDTFYLHLMQVFSSDQKVSCTISLKRSDGTTLAVQLESIIIDRASGQAPQCQIAMIDIAERKKAELALQHSEEQYRLLFTLNPNPMFVFDEQTLQIVAANEAMVSLYQWSHEEFLQMTAADIRPPEEVPKLRDAIKKNRNTRAAFVGLWRHMRKDGSLMDVEVTVSTIRYEGRKSRLVMVRDVTDRLRSHKALQMTQERLHLALEGAQMGSWAWDCDSDQAHWDDQLFALLGIPRQPNPVDTKKFFERVHQEDLPALRESIDQAIRTLSDFNHEFRIVRPDGEVRWLAGVGRFQQASLRGTPQIFGVNFDITTRKKMETDLKELNLRLEQRVLERTAVAETRARQIQALAGELAKAEQRERDHLAQILHDHLQQLLVAAKMRLTALLKSSSESKRAELQEGTYDLLSQAIDATRSLSVQLSPPVLREKGLAAALQWLAQHMNITCQLQVELACDTSADPQDESTRLLCYQAARELLFNVRKHARVDLARLELLAGDDGQIHMIVSDQGAGFDLLQYRMQFGTVQTFGLANIKQRLQIIGGDLAIESAPGCGTTVQLWIPRNFPSSRDQSGGMADLVAVSPPVPPSLNLKASKKISRRLPIRILLADDHQVMREALAEALTSHKDFEIVGEAGDGDTAVDLAHRFDPDVILMDVSMPHCDGIRATRRICRELPRTLVIGLSMHEAAFRSQPMLDAGAVAYVSKVSPLQDLIDTIHRFVKPRRNSARRKRTTRRHNPQ